MGLIMDVYNLLQPKPKWDEYIVICPHCYAMNLFKIEIYGTDKLSKEAKDRCVKCHKVL